MVSLHSDAKQDHGRLIKRDDSALIIIDMQEKLLPVISESKNILDNNLKLIATARILRLPVVVSEQQKLGATVKEITEALPEVRPIEKLTFNCFLTKSFEEKIRELGRRTLIISGIESHICVAQTALWAEDEGFNVHVVGDAIGSRAASNRTTAIERMCMNGITITSTEMVIYELLERAGTDEFKKILPLIK